ncbi:HIT family protein [Halostagnicola sp. A-GB9-2]|uniref:HIT family protein n=1 Tax=Halostagnicola sp. A-GB9-2 TaxID=3048066 RepID=UPI0024BFD651|nr:HIT family protein [Halostagnicola sp. A-GB9-2]MDJ1432303.1 HIT family protein [Halostagnicola sp. A-GB9-2]
MTESDECPFCEIVRGERESDVLLESADYCCFLDAYPVNEGHALVAPKTHVRYMEDLEDPKLYEFLREALAEVNRRYEPDSTNVGINNGSAAGQTIPHLHWHIIPRYEGDMEDPTGGVRGVIPEERTY